MEYAQSAAGNTLPGLLDGLAAEHGDRPALLGEGEALSYRDLAARVRQIAGWTVAQGLAGQTVCLLMPNRPDYVAHWLGLTRAGCTVALLNTQIRGDALLHSIHAAGSSALVAADGLLPVGLPASVRVWPPVGAGQHAAPLPALPAPSDRALLIYTSGTTGLPKAAVLTHARVVEWSFWFAGMIDTQPDDRLYDCLPLYHSVGGVVAVGAMLVKGGSVLIRERFSASRFWDDVTDGGCTVFQYIGELCRYLLAAPPHPRQRAHRLRLACGNGLAADCWAPLQHRFGIPHILEFYAATEGNVSLYNVEAKPGAIGRVPSFLAHRFPVSLVRCDTESGEPIRGADGFCQRCGPDEPGEALGRITASRSFDGYTDRSASGGKLLRDVFAAGDTWFRTGDLMRRDAAGYYYFLDRLGDTFRWKAENVSTTEVAAALRACPGVLDAVVYGVRLPGQEGRAGMAAVTGGPDLAVVRQHLGQALPTYAQPLFLRQCATLDATGTFKLVKTTLAAQGYAASPDPVWFNDHPAGRFVPVDAALLRSLADGECRV